MCEDLTEKRGHRDSIKSISSGGVPDKCSCLFYKMSIQLKGGNTNAENYQAGTKSIISVHTDSQRKASGGKKKQATKSGFQFPRSYLAGDSTGQK